MQDSYKELLNPRVPRLTQLQHRVSNVHLITLTRHQISQSLQFTIWTLEGYDIY